MASRKFRFVSPGVFLKEIDNSQLSAIPEGIGPVLIGRCRQGPMMRPHKVRSLEEFERVFGKPMPGNESDDVWRDGSDLLAEAYLPYAARAYLSADIDSPVTVVRLGGIAGDDAVADGDGEPGWKMDNAYGLVLFSSSSTETGTANDNAAMGELTGTLAAIFYGTEQFTASLVGIPLDRDVPAAAGSSAERNSYINSLPADIKATATIVITDAGGIGHGETFKLTDAAGTSTVYTVNGGVAAVEGGGSGGTATVGYQGVGGGVAGKVAAANAIKEAINRTTDANYTAVSNGVDTVTITQTAGGTSGNQNTSNGGVADGLGGATVGNFTGGSTAGTIVTKINHDNKFTIRLTETNGGVTTRTKDVKFSPEKIREEFNTNPVATNDQISRQASAGESALSDIYWLGETFEEAYKEFEANLAPGHKAAAAIVRMDSLMADFKSSEHGLSAARTGWIFGQDTEKTPQSWDYTKQQKLFRVLALHEGYSASKNLIVSIERINIPRENSTDAFGTFSVVVSKIMASSLVEIERFDNCNLNPISADYVAKKIGDQYVEWSPSELRNKLYGTHPNVSEYIRIEMDPDVDLGGGPTNRAHVPFGFYGPIVPADHTFDLTTGTGSLGGFMQSTEKLLAGHLSTSGSVRIQYPSLPLVHSGSRADDFMMGASPYKMTWATGSDHTEQTIINPGYADYLRKLSSLSGLTTSQKTGVAAAGNKYSFAFSLDEVVLVPTPTKTVSQISTAGDVTSVYYRAGSRNAGFHDSEEAPIANGASPTGSFSQHVALGSGSLRTLLDIVEGFRMPLVGGCDGLDVTEADAFNNRFVGANATTANNYAYASIDRAIELIKDPEILEHNLAAMPGITNDSLTTKLVRTCESRGDSLAIIDLPDVYKPPFQSRCTSFDQRLGSSPELSAKNLTNRQINSSYGATYYPWVKIKDEVSNRDVWVPPSVVALGVMAYTEERDEVWFAPAGFNRGGLNKGNAGLPVLQTSENLLSKDRDTLYAANINPIASFVSEGIVVFGQKTLQTTQSALDRINVRRLLIFVKKEVSRISNELLFEQNLRVTWNRFTSKVIPLLDSVKVRFGLSDFKVVLDSTTTTPDLIDRNIMYAKIFLKPARSIEFIAVDFVITNTGASFAD